MTACSRTAALEAAARGPSLRAAWHGHLMALSLSATSSPVRAPAYHLALMAAHLLGLLLVARLAHWPLWLAPVLLLAFCLPQWVRPGAAAPRLYGWAESLAPLAVPYAVAAVRLAWVYGLNRAAPAGLAYGSALALAAAWSALITLRAVGRLRLAWVLAAAGAAGLMAALLWASAPAGVTGSDPFAYVQMAVDLAERGTPRHHFPLAPLAEQLGLPTLPTTHVGYVLPNPAGLAPTVWPVGFSALLAVAYALGGERALLTFNVWVALAAVALTAWLAALLAPPRWRRLALAVGLAAAAVVATSPEQLVRLSVPLADGAAQVFTALALAFTLLAVRRRAVTPGRAAALAALAGLSLAAAYSVRYTQVLAGPGLLAAGWLALPRRPRWAFVGAFAAVALLGAVPDLLYRAALYGSPLRFGTGELVLFGLDALPTALANLRAEVLPAREFGWLWPLAALGLAYAGRRSRTALLAALAAYAPPLVFHLWYPFVRARDVLFVWPLLAAYAALGGAVAGLWLWRRGPPARLALVVALLAFGAARLGPVLALQHGFFTFGYLVPEQRAALESLAVLTEPEAVVACSLNSGAVELYGGRLAVRPGDVLQPGAGWTSEQWLAFAAALRAEGRPLYVLADSPELDEPLAALRAHYAVTPVAELAVPVFFHGGGSRNLTAVLWRVEEGG